MAYAKVVIELEIEYDELQYEDDGFIGPTNVREAFEVEFKPEEGTYESGYDFEYNIQSSKVRVEGHE